MKVRRLRWPILLALVAPLVLLLLLLLFPVEERIRGQIALRNSRRHLTEQGVNLDPESFSVPLPLGQNPAMQLIQLATNLHGKMLPGDPPPRMILTTNGTAKVGFRQEQIIQMDSTNTWTELESEISQNAEGLRCIEDTLRNPELRYPLDFREGPFMKFEHLLPAKRLTFWLAASAQAALQKGNMHQEALDALVSQIEMQRLLSGDRIMISELVRYALLAIAYTDSWEALQDEGWTDGQLSELQREWLRPSIGPGLIEALRGEEVFSAVSFDLFQNSNQKTYDALFWQDLGGDVEELPAWEKAVRSLPSGETLASFIKKEVYCRIWRFAWIHQQESNYLEQIEELISTAKEAMAAKSYAAALPEMQKQALAVGSMGWYDRLRFPSQFSVVTLGRCLNKAMRAESQRSMVVCAIALRRYQRKHDSLPSRLSDLIPEFLNEIPMDYMDGKPLRYRPGEHGNFLLYSVGEDGIDNHGDASLLPDKQSLQNPWARKDFVWPMPE